MPTKKASEFESLFIKRMMIGGVLLIVTGILRLNNIDWPIISIVLGAILLLKSFILYSRNKRI